MRMRKLTKSRTNRVLDGVLGGVGEYFNIDPVVVRILYIIFTISTAIGGGIVIYIIAMIVIPHSNKIDAWDDEGERIEAEVEASQSAPSAPMNGGLIVGMILVFVGGVFLLNNLLEINIMQLIRRYGQYVWSVGLIAVGLFIIFRKGTK